MLHLGKSALREASEANTFRVWWTCHPGRIRNNLLLQLTHSTDVFCSTAASVSLQEMKVFTELGHPFVQLQDALLRQAWPLIRSNESGQVNLCCTKQGRCFPYWFQNPLKRSMLRWHASEPHIPSVHKRASLWQPESLNIIEKYTEVVLTKIVWAITLCKLNKTEQ